MGWLQTHLETFVKPQLGFIPEKLVFFTDAELTVIKNLWRSAKTSSASRPMLLTGRDAFVFEILARRENFPTVFRPDISRATVKLVSPDLYREYFLFDTGFMGTIAKHLEIPNFSLASAARVISHKHQAFPNLTGARGLALKIESTPKYWKTAQYQRVEDSETGIALKLPFIVQEFSERTEFARAAGVTIQVFTNSARKNINIRKPLGVIGKWQDYFED